MRIENEYIKFTQYISGNSGYPESKVEITIGSDSTLTEVLEKFEAFLRASGFVFNGTLDFIDEKIHESESEDF